MRKELKNLLTEKQINNIKWECDFYSQFIFITKPHRLSILKKLSILNLKYYKKILLTWGELMELLIQKQKK